MKEIAKKVLPNPVLKLFKKKKIKIPKFENKSTEQVFAEIYKTNVWESEESISGPGSEIIQTQTLIENLEKLLIDFNITSMLDIPCGDFNWMRNVVLDKIDYIGADIVEELIKSNLEQYKETNLRKFKVLNLISDTLPKKDLLFVRDCLVHLSYENIFKAIKNIKSSGCKYLLTTTFVDCEINLDITTGGWRVINLQKKPFNFPDPILVINENCTECNGIHKDKSMALWEISKI